MVSGGSISRSIPSSAEGQSIAVMGIGMCQPRSDSFSAAMRIGVSAVIAGLLAQAPCGRGQDTSARPEPVGKLLSVCEVVIGHQKLAQKVVRVRGQWRPGGHGVYLAPERECSTKLQTDGYTWSDSIHLRDGEPRSFDFDKMARFEIALENAKEARGLRKDEPMPDSVTVTVIATGVPLAQPKLFAVFSSKQWVAGNGFGHLNFFPVELRYSSLELVSVKP